MLNELKKNGKVGFIPFIVVGDPNLETSARAVEILIEEGADLIELGVPFSDALADGPVIQTASERASKNTSLHDVFHFAEEILAKHPGFPFLLFTYLNPIMKMGIENFAKKAREVGIHSVLVVDLPPEEAQFYTETMAKMGVKTVFLASPTTTPERLKLVSEASTGFIYYVSRVGVTGVQSDVSSSLEVEVNKVRALTPKPIAIGFGISTGEQARQVSRLADAVVVGSAFVKLIATDPSLAKVRILAKEIRSNSRI